MANKPYALPEYKVNRLLVLSTSPYKNLTRLNIINDSEDLVNWLTEIALRKEAYNHPERVDNVIKGQCKLSLDTITTSIYIHDFKYKLHCLPYKDYNENEIKKQLTIIAKDYYLLIHPVGGTIGDCYAASYIHRTVVDNVKKQNPCLISLLPRPVSNSNGCY